MNDLHTDRYEMKQSSQFIQTMIHEDPAHLNLLTDKKLKANTGFKIGQTLASQVGGELNYTLSQMFVISYSSLPLSNSRSLPESHKLRLRNQVSKKVLRSHGSEYEIIRNESSNSSNLLNQQTENMKSRSNESIFEEYTRRITERLTE